MPIIAMGNGSVHGLESPFTTVELFCSGALPSPKLEYGAICPDFANDLENYTLRICA